MKKIVIVGLGLIGSSLALCIKKSHPKSMIVGIDTSQQTLDIALKRGIIDQAATNIATVASKADVILLCTPVNRIIAELKILATLPLKKDCIISDVGSTKQTILDEAQKLNLPHFVGGHPMAGSHKSGVLAADEYLFENAYYILTPCSENQTNQLTYLKELLEGTNCKFVEMSATEHDQITGMLSHLPHIIASGLVNQSHDFNSQHPRAQQLAAGGFRDITRIASSDPQMWTDILLSNQKVLIEMIEKWQQKMVEIQHLLVAKNKQGIYDFFDQAKETRDQLPVHQKGAIPAFYDLFVDVPDVPGVIAEITGILGNARISLTNVKILETREDIFGILQLTFKNEDGLKQAKQCIETLTSYHCYYE